MFYSIFVCAHYQLSGGGWNCQEPFIALSHPPSRHSLLLLLLLTRTRSILNLPLSSSPTIYIYVGAGSRFLLRCWYFAYFGVIATHKNSVTVSLCKFESVFDLQLSGNGKQWKRARGKGLIVRIVSSLGFDYKRAQDIINRPPSPE